MKKSVFIIIISILGFTSCDDFLNLEPEYQINEVTYYQSEDDFETAIVGIYNTMQNLHNVMTLYITELATDNTTINWTTPTTNEVECDEMNITSSNGFVNNIWTYCFTIIAYSNNILARIDNIDMNENKRSQFKGEALFLRAYSYFYLVRLFGDVPIVNVAFRSPNEISSYNMTRQPVNDVYLLIEDDLKNSANLLSGFSSLSKGRASVGAAKTLLGKVYLTKGDYSNATTYLKEVIDMGIYSLVDDYGSLFTNDNESLKESIFEIEYLSGNLGEGNNFSSVFTPSLFNMAIFPNNMNGSGRIVPTEDLFTSYENNDLRKNVSVADSVLLIDGTYEHTLYGLKFVDFTTGTSGDGGINFTVLRYADVLLMYAECLNETGETVLAHDYLNMVRKRAGIALLDGLSTEEFTLVLEKERRIEFLFEGHRWFDLIRTGRAKTVLNNYFSNSGFSFTVDDHELVLPIPDDEIEIDPRLTQNDGY